jgi:hypothetical protein
MIRITFIEFLFRGIPEGFLFLLMFYELSKTKIEYKTYILSSFICGTLSYLIRMLPIQLGINSMLNICIMVLFCVKIIKVNAKKTIQIVMFIYILEFICEFFNMLMIIYVFHISLEDAFKSPILKLIYGSPSLIMFTFSIYLVHIYMNKKTLINVK